MATLSLRERIAAEGRMPPDLLAKVTICPVRHHSPVVAMAVERRLVTVKPRLVLVEGPCDAGEFIPLLLQPDTRPPVAILAYRSASAAGRPRVMVDPFCDYSPELVALRTAAHLGADARFFDAPAALWLDRIERVDHNQSGGETLPDASSPDLYQSLADRFGYRSHDEFWDSRFEMAAIEAVGEPLAAYGDMVRDWLAAYGVQNDLDLTRESWMLIELARAIDEGYDPREIVVVCGAAHVAGLRAGLIDSERLSRLRQSTPARLTLIPYSYLRLSEQSGYGAGNRAPAFYEEVWRRRGDWNQASVVFLLRLMNEMRVRGFALSLADVIEARKLAINLAGLRDKPAIGIEELSDAVRACYGRGGHDPTPHLTRLLGGDEVGALSSLVARTALQQEFHDQVKRYGIPLSDSRRELRLNLTNPSERQSSAFLHRLTVARIPFASLARTGSAILNLKRGEAQDSLVLLMALREKWELRWTPATDIRLIELSSYGSTLVEVCQRLLREALLTARGMEGASDVLRQVVVGRLDGLYAEVLDLCERVSTEDDDFASLSRASYMLDVLAGYGAAPELAGLLPRLSERVFIRACLLLPAAAGASDEDAARIAEGMKALHQVAARRRQSGADMDLFVERLGRTVHADGEAHAVLAGLALAMLYLDGHISDDDLVGVLGRRLSRGQEPLAAAQFVEGLFSMNRSVLVRNQAIIGSLTAFLTRLENESFLAVLPILRRGLANLSWPEMGYLITTIAAALGVKRDAIEQGGLDASQLNELAALDGEIGDLFD